MVDVEDREEEHTNEIKDGIIETRKILYGASQGKVYPAPNRKAYQQSDSDDSSRKKHQKRKKRTKSTSKKDVHEFCHTLGTKVLQKWNNIPQSLKKELEILLATPSKFFGHDDDASELQWSYSTLESLDKKTPTNFMIAAASVEFSRN